MHSVTNFECAELARTEWLCAQMQSLKCTVTVKDMRCFAPRSRSVSVLKLNYKMFSPLHILCIMELAEH